MNKLEKRIKKYQAQQSSTIKFMAPTANLGISGYLPNIPDTRKLVNKVVK